MIFKNGNLQELEEEVPEEDELLLKSINFEEEPQRKFIKKKIISKDGKEQVIEEMQNPPIDNKIDDSKIKEEDKKVEVKDETAPKTTKKKKTSKKLIKENDEKEEIKEPEKPVEDTVKSSRRITASFSNMESI